MTLTEDLIRGVVQEVLAGLQKTKPAAAPARGGAWGVFQDVDAAVTAATDAQKAFAARGLDDRKKAVDCIRRICRDQADVLGREELEETKIGRLEHKIEKLI